MRVDHPCAMYIHCLSHKLNLVLVNSCSVNRTAVGFFNTTDELFKYFSKPRAHDVFLNTQKLLGIRSRESVQQSDTHWACRWNIVLAVKTQYSAIVTSLDTLSDSAESRAVEAAGIAKHMKTAEFAVCLAMFEDLLLTIYVVHKALQGREMTLGDASNLTEKLQCNFAKQRCVESWLSLRSRAEEFFAENDVRAFQSSGHCTVGSTARNVKTPLTM